MLRREMSEVALGDEIDAKTKEAQQEASKTEKKAFNKELNTFVAKYSKELPFAERDALQDQGVLEMPKEKILAIKLLKERELVSIIKDEKLSKSVKVYAMSERWKEFKKSKAKEDKEKERAAKRQAGAEKRKATMQAKKEQAEKEAKAKEEAAKAQQPKSKQDIKDALILKAMMEAAQKRRQEEEKVQEKPKGKVTGIQTSKLAEQAFLNSMKSKLGVQKEDGKEKPKIKGLRFPSHKGKSHGDTGR